MGKRLFISDLHLQDKRPDITQAFVRLLETFRGQVSELYILGDLFEIWLGDDYLTRTAEEAGRALERFAQGGSQLFFMAGNRDFLLGKDYADRCGLQRIDEPYPMTLREQPCILLHGDTLCTQDKPYMEFRRQVRDPAWQEHFLNLPIAERLAFGQKARAQSQTDSQEKSPEILDVTQSEVIRVMEHNQANLLIHGHTHRPAQHQLTTSMGESTRMVLGDWHQQGWYILADERSLSLISFPF